MADDASSYVYLLFRLDGTPLYLGKGKGNRWLKHFSRGIKHPNKHLRRIIVAALAQGKELPVIKIRENLTDAQALELERIFIAAIGREANGGPLVNLTDGGDGPSGYRHTAEQCAAASAIRKGVKHAPEWGAAISAGLKNYKKTPKHIANAGAGRRSKSPKSGWWSTEEGRAKQATNNPGHTGHHHSDETKEIIRRRAIRQHASMRAQKMVQVSTAWAEMNSVRYPQPTAA